MKFTNKTVISSKEILYNDHFVSIPYDCTSLTNLATNDVIPAGTIIPSNDGNAVGILLEDVNLNENPNGAVVIHGFIKQSALPKAPTQTTVNTLMSKGVYFMDAHGKPQLQKYSVTYDLNGATGTAVTDGSSPYTYGSTVTAKTAPTITTYPAGMTKFDKWNTKADGTGTSYAASDTFTIYDDVTLYAIYKAS